MQKLFQDILDIDQVQGVIFISSAGDTLYNDFSGDVPVELKEKNWASVANILSGIREAEFIYDQSRLYILTVETGYLITVMSNFASIALVRLACSIIQPALGRKKERPKGLSRFFRRKTGE